MLKHTRFLPIQSNSKYVFSKLQQKETEGYFVKYYPLCDPLHWVFPYVL